MIDEAKHTCNVNFCCFLVPKRMITFPFRNYFDKSQKRESEGRIGVTFCS